MIFSWSVPAWQDLMDWRSRLPHALLLAGRPGIGKGHLAQIFAQSLLCQAPLETGVPCQVCASCGWFEQGNHPDFRLVQPDSMAPESEEEPRKEKKKSSQIRIEQIRDLEGFLSVGTHRGGLRIILLNPAEAMNTVTQNALLKSLEEPPPSTLFLLVSSHIQKLLPTVRSRCQTALVPLPEQHAALQWLKEQGVEKPESALSAAAGAPLAALEAASLDGVLRAFLHKLQDPGFDPLDLGQSCGNLEPIVVVGWLQRWVYDVLQVRMAGVIRYFPDFASGLQAAAAQTNAVKLLELQRKLTQARGLAQHPLNPRLYYESLFMDYRNILIGK